MTMLQPKRLTISLFVLIALVSAPLPRASAETYERVYNAQTQRYVYVQKPTVGQRIGNFFRKPVVKKMGVGTAAGVGVSAIAGKSLLKGGVAGAATGLGIHAADRSHTLARKPLARRVVKGGVIGTGVAVAAGTALLPVALTGAAVGAAAHYIKADP